MAEPVIRPDEIVRTSVMDWATQCYIADATDRMDTPAQGLAAALAFDDRPVVYCFSNGRKFRDRRNPYE